jgi:hypothetical protein
MAKTPKEAARIVFGNKEKKQFPDPEGLEREKPSSAIEGSTQPLGFETRLRAKFSEQVSEIGIEARHREEMKNKGMRQTFADRSNKRPKHLQHPAPIQGSHYKQTPQMEKPHYEEYEKMENKTFTQFVTEAKRGRPRKLRPGEKADTEHLQDQLSKLTHANHVTVHFKNGEKHDIPRAHANKALIHLSSLKPIHRADHVEHMHSSKENFYHTLANKSIPSKKKTITLAGPKLRKEEVEHDDGWYAHKEMHGKDAVSKEDWKKGIRKKPSVKKEEVDRPKQNTKTDIDVRKHTRLAADALGRAHHLGKDHEDYAMNMAKYERHRKMALGEEVEQIDEISKNRVGEYLDKYDDYEKKLIAKVRKNHGKIGKKDDETHARHFAGALLAMRKLGKTPKTPKVPATEEVETTEKKKKDHHTLLQKFKHRIDEVKAIKGTHATKKHAADVINPGKVGYAGKSTKPKVQSLRREDYAPLEDGEKQTHVDQKTANAKSRVQGGEKPKKPKMELTKEAWELYDSLSDSHKTIFEKMAQSERDKLVDKYISSGGQIQKVKSAKRSEDSKSFPASKRAGTVFNKGAKRVHLQNQGVKGK